MTADHLRTIGWNVRDVFWERDAIRSNLYQILRRRTIGGPALPLPHGRINDYFWNYIPDTVRVSDDALHRTLQSFENWWIVSENPRQATYQLEGAPKTIALLREDFFIVPVAEGGRIAQDGPVLLLSHEGEGPWILEHGQPKVEMRPPRKEASVIPDWEVPEADVAVFARAKRLILQGMKEKGIYIPSGFRRTLRFPGDHLWNYLPDVFETTLKTGSLAIELLERADQVVTWTDATSAAWVLAKPSRKSVLSVPNAYYLEWPHARWLIAVPADFVKKGSDSWVMPSLVPLQ